MRIRNGRLVAEAMERQKLEQEVRLARQIQVALLPATLPVVPGYELHGGNLPSRGVSGDFYKVLFRDEGRECAFLIADVSGKGVAASLLTASLEALSAMPLENGVPPAEICNHVSRLLHQRTPPEKFATAFLAILEPATGRLTYVNAGHNPGLLVRADGSVEWLKASGVPLGLIATATYAMRETALAPGDTLVLYTDGITEASDPDDEEFGAARLLGVCFRNRDAEPRELAKVLETELEAFVRGVPYADDRTLVLVKRTA
jgi:sigma-B regulation protein RsbU (phosphoserine phosphatase)